MPTIAVVLGGFVALSVSGLLLMLGVKFVSPDSPNGYFRAVAALLGMSVAAAGFAVVLSGAPVLAAGAVLLVPFVTLKLVYGLSFFRSLVLQIVLAAAAIGAQRILSTGSSSTPEAATTIE